MRTVLWQDPDQAGAERCTLDADGGPLLSGTALLGGGGAPVEVRYAVHVDTAGRTRRVEVGVDGAAGRHQVLVEVDGDGRWLLDGVAQDQVRGCLDVDLEFSPATNMLPIRRLGLAVGDEAVIEAAWLRFPALRVARSEQRYRRLAEDRYRFSLDGFSAELVLDEAGLVRTYGGFWRQVAAG